MVSQAMWFVVKSVLVKVYNELLPLSGFLNLKYNVLIKIYIKESQRMLIGWGKSKLKKLFYFKSNINLKKFLISLAKNFP